MAKKGSSKHKQEEYKRYQNEGRWEKNKLIKLKRHCKKFPEDLSAANRLTRGNFIYSRNKFKHNKPAECVKKLKLFNPNMDDRKSIRTQMREISRGEIILRRS